MNASSTIIISTTLMLLFTMQFENLLIMLTAIQTCHIYGTVDSRYIDNFINKNDSTSNIRILMWIIMACS